jgi:hypothetical protein
VSRPDPTSEPIAIACSLDAESLAVRTDEWREFVASSVAAIETDDTTIRLVLQQSDAALLIAASLGAREKACCAFFDVDIEIYPERRALRFSVPAGAEEVVAAFAALIRSFDA